MKIKVNISRQHIKQEEYAKATQHKSKSKVADKSKAEPVNKLIYNILLKENGKNVNTTGRSNFN